MDFIHIALNFLTTIMEIKLPKMGEGSESGTVVSILVKVGDDIKVGQSVIELESDKAVAPVPATVAGKVTQIFVKEGQTISVGARIVDVAAAGEPASAQPTAAAPEKAAAPAPAAKTVSVAQPAVPVPQYTAPVEPGPDDGFFAKPGSTVATSPSIRKTAS